MSTYGEASKMMYEIMQARDAIDRMSERLRSDQPVFRPISLAMPRMKPAELGLLRIVSYFYVLCHEIGAVNVKFLVEKAAAYAVGHESADYLLLVNRLRTYFQHDLNPAKQRSNDINQYCEEWFKAQCGTWEPMEDPQWISCLLGFLCATRAFFHALNQCIRAIESDESIVEVLREWEVRLSRSHAPHEFDPIIAQVARDVGRDHLDPARLRKQFASKWIDHLQALTGTYSFEIEARRLIEHTLLTETARVLPITGTDIMASLTGIKPGLALGQLLKAAKRRYDEEPCSGPELLQWLGDNLDQILDEGSHSQEPEREEPAG